MDWSVPVLAQCGMKRWPVVRVIVDVRCRVRAASHLKVVAVVTWARGLMPTFSRQERIEHMATVTFRAEDLRDPWDSERTLIGEEDAADCDGVVCGEAFSDEYGEMVQPDPHHHIVVSGEEPKASARYYLIR